MPKVDGKKFPYTAKGKAAAAKARKTLPAKANAKAKANAFGQMGTRKRKS